MKSRTLNSWHAGALGLLVTVTLSLVAPMQALAKHNDDDCHVNQPNCTPGGDFYIHWEKPAESLNYKLADRAWMWVDAWRSYQNNSKWWPKETYDPGYVYPTTFTGIFYNQCQTQVDWDWFVNNLGTGSGVNKYKWTVDGVVQHSAADCSGVNLVFNGEGIHDVKLEVFKPGQSTPYLTKTEDVRVRDYLVVLFGDSAASGEGAPDFARGPNQEWGLWTDRRCHRSEWAAVPQAVQELERSDPHSTVTFLNFACSGATIQLWEPGQGVGILDRYAGIEPTVAAAEYGDNDPTFYLPSQVDQLSYALHFKSPTQYDPNARKVDMLFTTGGINDVRFAKLAVVCVLEDDCPYQYSDIYGGANDVKSTFNTLASQIPAAYVALADALADEGITPDETPIYVMQYPDAFQYDDGSRCKSMLWDVLPSSSVWYLALDPIFGPLVLSTTILGPFLEYEIGINFIPVLASALTTGLEWDQDEIDWLADKGMAGLDKGVRDGAAAAGFEFIDGVQAAFAKHGYCAEDNWIRQAAEASFVQGPWNIVSKPLNPPYPPPIGNPFEDLGLGVNALTKGLMHPAPAGYAAWAKLLRPYLAALKNHAPVVKPDTYKLDMSVTPVEFDTGFGDGVLLNDYDPDDDPVRASIKVMPKYGTATLTQNGRLRYTPNAQFTTSDTMWYEVTDGAATATGKVTFLSGNVRYVPPSWNWNFPTGEETPVVEIGGIAQFPVCNRCGDMVLRVDPELSPGFGRINFSLDSDRWILRYAQNGLIPETLPWDDIVVVELGRMVLGEFELEGRAEIIVRIEGNAAPSWSWVFRTPEAVVRGAETQFDLCDSCQDFEVRVTVEPQSGSVAVKLDLERNRWVATYTHDLASELIGDGFGVAIGNVSGDLFIPVDSTRVSLDIVDGN